MDRKVVYHERLATLRVVSVANGKWVAQVKEATCTRAADGWRSEGMPRSREEAIALMYRIMPLEA